MFNAFQKLKSMIGNPEIELYFGDLNAVEAKDFKVVYAGASATNRPVNANGYCVTMAYNPNRSNKKQIYYVQSNSNLVFERTCNSGVWTEWISKQQTITTGTEYETGRIIDGKKEYAKRFAAVALPSSAGNITIQTGLGNINFIKLEGAIMKKDGSDSSNLPWIYTGQAEVYHYYSNTTKNITIRTSGDASNRQAVETIYYTKN